MESILDHPTFHWFWGIEGKKIATKIRGQRVIFQGEYTVDHDLALDRMTLKPIADSRVKQVIKISKDHGNTWEASFAGFYDRWSKLLSSGQK